MTNRVVAVSGALLALTVAAPAAEAAVTASKSELEFGPQAIGTTSAPQTFTLTNNGEQQFISPGTSTTENFTFDCLCDHNQETPMGGTVTMSVTFHPPAFGAAGLKSYTESFFGQQDSASTPPAKVTARGTAVGGGGGGGGLDTTKPGAKLAGKATQDVDKLFVTVNLDENGSVAATGTVSVPNSSKVFRFKKVKKQAVAGTKVKLRLKLPKKAKGKVKAGLRAGKKLKAKLKVVATDAAGNKRTKKKTVGLKL